MLVDPKSINLLRATDTKALLSMLDFMDTAADQDAIDKLLVRIEF